MPSHKQLLTLFVPALAVVAIGLIIAIIQYDPLYPKENNNKSEASDLIPIFTEDPIVGYKKAPITIIAFEDFGCEGCKAQSDIFDQIMLKHPKKIKVVWKSLTVTRFPISTQRAHEYGLCANEQGKFSEFKELAFVNGLNLSQGILDLIVEETEMSERKLTSCLNSAKPTKYLSQNESLANLLNVQAVPTIFIDNVQINTPSSIEEWEMVLGL